MPFGLRLRALWFVGVEAEYQSLSHRGPWWRPQMDQYWHIAIVTIILLRPVGISWGCTQQAYNAASLVLDSSQLKVALLSQEVQPLNTIVSEDDYEAVLQEASCFKEHSCTALAWIGNAQFTYDRYCSCSPFIAQNLILVRVKIDDGPLTIIGARAILQFYLTFRCPLFYKIFLQICHQLKVLQYNLIVCPFLPIALFKIHGRESLLVAVTKQYKFMLWGGKFWVGPSTSK